jgi:hypothetical protein
MQTPQILCPVDHVKMTFTFPKHELNAVIDFLINNTPLPARAKAEKLFLPAKRNFEIQNAQLKTQHN